VEEVFGQEKPIDKMRKYGSKWLTNYAKKLGFKNPLVWYSKQDGWWLEADQIEEYLGAQSSGAKRTIEQIANEN